MLLWQLEKKEIPPLEFSLMLRWKDATGDPNMVLLHNYKESK